MKRFLLVASLVLAACGARPSQPTASQALSFAGAMQNAPELAASWVSDGAGAVPGLLSRVASDDVMRGRAAAAALRRVVLAADGAPLPGLEVPAGTGDAWQHWLLADAAYVVQRDAALRADPLAPPPRHPYAASFWRTMGPISSLDAAGFPPRQPLLRDTLLPDSIELPGATLWTRRVHDDGHDARLASGAGVWIAEAFVSVPEAGEVVVSAGAPGEWRLWLDDTVVLERSLTERYGAELRAATVTLSAGTYRIRMELASDAGAAASVRMVPLDAALALEWPETRAEADGRVRAVRDEALWPGAEIDDWFAAAELAMLANDAEAALALAGSLPSGVPAAVAARELAEHLTQVPPNLRDDFVVDALSEAIASEPSPIRAQAALLEHLVQAGQLDEAEQLVGELRDVADPGVVGQLAIADYMGARGLPELERRHLEAAAHAGLDSCELRGRLLDAWASVGQVQDPTLLPGDWLACDDVAEWAVRSFWLPRGELEPARRYAATLLARNPSDRALAWLVADVASAQGDGGGVLAALRHEAAWGAEPELPAWELVDRTAASGDLAAAIQMLGTRRVREPSQVSLHRAEAWLAGEAFLARERIDGRAFVDAYLADEPSYGGDVVYVLDYSKARYFEDGSWYEVVHQIFQPRTRDAIGAFGEQGIPGDATLLQARTLKRDGRTFVAPDIVGKDSISMPHLEVGDFIELEWVRSAGRGTPERLGVLGSRFYFQVADGVLHHTEAVYEYPAAWEDNVVIDLRNFDGEAMTEELPGGVVRRSYRMSATLPPRPEPRAATGDEWLPSVRFTLGADDAAVVERYRNLVASRTVPDSLVVWQAQELAAGTRTPCAAARRIFRFVNDEIIELSGFFSDPPPWVLHAGEGERLSLTWSMLEAAGLEPDLFFVLPLDGDNSAGAPVDPNVYELTAIRVRGRGGECWMEPEWENQPFNFLRPEAQGQPALAVAGPSAGDRIVTPRWPAENLRSRLELTVAIDADGNATVRGRELLPMQSWAGIRSFAEEVSDMSEVAREFEAALSRSFPAVTMQDVAFERVDEPDAPIAVVYEFTSAGLARRDADGTWRIDTTIYERPLASSYASLASRRTDLVLGLPHDEDLLVFFELPAGADAIRTPESVSLEDGANRFERTWRVRGTSVELVRSARIPAQRIVAQEYGPFAQFARDAEASGRVLIEWELP